jgi:hypothetical protein
LSDKACGILTTLLRDERERYRGTPQHAEAIRANNGEAPFDKSLDAADVAATTIMVRGLLAFDECVMKP